MDVYQPEGGKHLVGSVTSSSRWTVSSVGKSQHHKGPTIYNVKR